MGADIVNLRRAKKAKAKAEAEARAAENRLRFGRTRHERERLDAAAKLAEQRLDGHRRGDADPPAPESPPRTDPRLKR